MPELRWTLLVIGVVFIAALVVWELRRPHQASRQPHEGSDPPPGVEPSWGNEVKPAATRALREPTLTLPEIRVREPFVPQELPVVEITDDEALGRVQEPVSRHIVELAASDDISSEASPADAGQAARVEEPDWDPEDLQDLSAPDRESIPEDEVRPQAVDPGTPEDEIIPEADVREEESFAHDIVPSAAATTGDNPAVVPALPAARPDPIVDWPPEDQRRLVALRLVAAAPERFTGRALRQALAAEGFVLGHFDIFHKPDADNRAVLSAASLTKPGTFDLETMDTQRFVGLNLFAVLPGPKPPRKTFDELLLTARTLNERLQGALQDERGGPLTPTRIIALREGLGAGAGS